MAERLKEDWRAADLPAPQRALCEFAEKLSRSPDAMRREDIDALRAQGWSDRAVLDAVLVIGQFNFFNRLADGLGIELEPQMRNPESKYR